MTKIPPSPSNGAEIVDDAIAIFTAYAPSENLKTSVLETLKQCASVVVSDNTPLGKRNARDVLGNIKHVTIIGDGANIGLASALNNAVPQATTAEYFFLLDQDSCPQPGLIQSLHSILQVHPEAGAIGPAPWDEINNRFIDPRTSNRDDLAELPVIITSAMLIRKSAFISTSGFRDEFFVDCVDQDFCLQLRKSGWKVLQDKRILLPHSLGEMKWHGYGPFKLRATHHPTWRLYWAARNGVMLSKEYFSFDKRWALTNFAILGYWIITVALFEKPRIAKLQALFRGIGDGSRGRVRNTYLPAGAIL
ncbi:MAG: glycosyltransferase [Rhodoluna sp.]